MYSEGTSYKLADLCDSIDYGYTASAVNATVGPRFLRITDIVSGHINWREVPSCDVTPADHKKYRLNDGDIVIARTGATTGASTYIEEPPDALFASYLVRLKINQAKADSRYISYFLKSADFWEYMRGVLGDKSAQPNASAKTMTQVKLRLPPLNEQRAIACILGSLDDKIELNRRMNQTLEAMARAIFKSWFVDFDPIPGFGTHKEWQDSPLGRIPKGWEVGKADELFNISRETVSPEKFLEEVFDHYSIPAFDEGRRPKIERGNEIKSNKNLVPGGAVLISKLNPRIPRVWLPLTRTGNRAIASTEFLVAMPRKVTKEYLYSLFSSHAFMDVFATLVTGTSGSHQRVKPDYLLKMRFIVPPIPLVDQFTSLVKPILLKIAQNIEESRILAAIRDTLLPKLLSGEIRVKEAERFISNEHLA